MRRLMTAFFVATACAIAYAEALPSWAVGTFKGEVKNWCYVYDDPNDIGPWYGTATLSVATDGKVSGEIKFGDLTGKPQGAYTVVEVSDILVRIRAVFNWKEGRQVIDVSTSDVVVRNSDAGVVLEYVDSDTDGIDKESCPVEGVLTKTSSGSADGEILTEWKTARTVSCVCWDASFSTVVGSAIVKCGKANKRGLAKVSAKITLFTGKPVSYRPITVDVTRAANPEGFVFCDWGDSNGQFDPQGTYFEGTFDGINVMSANMGGNWTRTDARVYVDSTSLPTGTIAELLPVGEPILTKGGKWAFNKAAMVKLSKDKSTMEWDTSKGKTNLSGLRLTYAPKAGTFKGSFKVYALEDTGKTTKLKKYIVNVTGVVADGVGYGKAICKKPAISWAVSVK